MENEEEIDLDLESLTKDNDDDNEEGLESVYSGEEKEGSDEEDLKGYLNTYNALSDDQL